MRQRVPSLIVFFSFLFFDLKIVTIIEHINEMIMVFSN